MLRGIMVDAIRIINRIDTKIKHMKVSETTEIIGRCEFAGKTDQIQIGDNTIIRSGIYGGNYVGLSKSCFCTLANGEIVIGNNVGISNSIFISRCSIMIEDDVMIGGGCKFYDSDFHSLDYPTRITSMDDVKSAPILIKRGAFIGADSIILKGVTIGEESIVGAGSVVTKSIPDGEIWGGNPAKLIRKLRIDNASLERN